jgi:alkylresorcinol/alkylpyrone synthase
LAGAPRVFSDDLRRNASQRRSTLFPAEQPFIALEPRTWSPAAGPGFSNEREEDGHANEAILVRRTSFRNLVDGRRRPARLGGSAPIEPSEPALAPKHKKPIMTLLPINKPELRVAYARGSDDLSVDILSIATANPPRRFAQKEVLANAAEVFPQFGRLNGLFENTGVEFRYMCQPMSWYRERHSWEERTAVYQKHALELLERISIQAVADAGLKLSDIDALITNTITGLAIPSLDALLIDRLDFSPNVERLPIFGLGCGGGVAGLSRAARIAQARPGSNVLFLTVDLCSLCIRPNDPSAAMFVSAALFGDGAAAVVLHASPQSDAVPYRNSTTRPKLLAFGEHTWRNTRHIMGWEVKGDGFGVVLSPELPALMHAELARVVDQFLHRNKMARSDFKGFLFHPGGRKILETAEAVLEIDRAEIAHSWAVLREFGNMSSATALFILERAMRTGDRGRHLLAAFGPGFSAYFAVLDL